MADTRKEYEVDINGVKHTLLLSPEDAERYGKAAAPKPNKQASAPNKGA